MNKQQVELDVVSKAHEATHKIRQPSWAAHCQALSINMDEAEKEAQSVHTRPTIKIKTPPYDFRPTPICTPIPVVMLNDVDLEWDK